MGSSSCPPALFLILFPHQLKQPFYYLFSIFPCRRVAGRFNLLVSEKPLGIFEGFLQDWPGSRILIKHAKADANIDCPNGFWHRKHTQSSVLAESFQVSTSTSQAWHLLKHLLAPFHSCLWQLLA